jgi:IstB-like ATP binding protein.
MERTQVLELMGTLKLYGMRGAYDEVMATGIKRQHEPPRIVGDLLSAEIAEKQARSIKYQLTVAKLPIAKDIDEFDFDGTPVNELLVRDLANGTFVADQRNAVVKKRHQVLPAVESSPLAPREVLSALAMPVQHECA